MLFREVPPWTTVVEVLSLLHVPTDFPCTFQKTNINMENSVQCAGLLEPYYIPCKVKQYLEHTDPNRWITIIRHILTPHGYAIEFFETTRNKKKAIFYSIDRAEGVLKSPVAVDFS